MTKIKCFLNTVYMTSLICVCGLLRALTMTTSYRPTSQATFASVVKSRLKSDIFSKCEAFIVHGTCDACVAASATYHLIVRRPASIADVISTAVLTTSDTGTQISTVNCQINLLQLATTVFIDFLSLSSRQY